MTKTVLITGTTSGIGKAAVEEFAQAGWNVAATMRTIEPGMFTDYENVKLYHLDVTNIESISKAMQAAVKDFGGIDVVVNNAGYAVDGVFEAMDDEVIKRQFDTNVFGLMRVTRYAIKQMRKQGNGGTIIQVASMGGRVAFPLYSLYHGTKWAVEGFSESLRYELEPFNIRVKIIEPGVIKTEFYGSSRTFVKPTNDTAYDSFMQKVEKVSQGSGKNGEPAAKVAATIVKAANDRSGKLRYIVGSPAPLLLAVRRLVPDRMFGWLIRRGYRL